MHNYQFIVHFHDNSYKQAYPHQPLFFLLLFLDINRMKKIHLVTEKSEVFCLEGFPCIRKLKAKLKALPHSTD